VKNKLVLGTVQMGLPYGVNNSVGKISFENSCQILSKAFDLGISTLDTAEAYGDAHRVIGKFHKANPELKFDIITKIPHEIDDLKIEERIKNYCHELHVDFLEVLLFHSFDSYQKNQHLLVALGNIKNQGLVKNIGVSVYTNDQIETLLMDDLVSVVQMPFNLLDNESIRGDLMQKLKDKGKKIHTRSAFLQGLFFKETSSSNVIVQKLSKQLLEINMLAKQERINIASLALGYCMAQNKIDQVLMGVDSVEHLIDNVKAANYQIRKDVLEKINEIRVDNLDLLNPSLWH
jgi:aryl-alcohol dehydrogenase-like predicted oxidoreductase